MYITSLCLIIFYSNPFSFFALVKWGTYQLLHFTLINSSRNCKISSMPWKAYWMFMMHTNLEWSEIVQRSNREKFQGRMFKKPLTFKNFMWWWVEYFSFGMMLIMFVYSWMIFHSLGQVCSVYVLIKGKNLLGLFCVFCPLKKSTCRWVQGIWRGSQH